MKYRWSGVAFTRTRVNNVAGYQSYIAPLAEDFMNAT